MMVLSLSQNEIFDKLIRQEELIGELYALFSSQFPQHASFWKELSLAEVRHAKLLRKLKDASQKAQISFDESNITIITLNAYLDRLGEVLEKARKGEFSLQTALSCAVDYDSSLVERKIFTFFDSTNEKHREVLGTLQSETEEHVEYIKRIQRSVSKISR